MEWGDEPSPSRKKENKKITMVNDVRLFEPLNQVVSKSFEHPKESSIDSWAFTLLHLIGGNLFRLENNAA